MNRGKETAEHRAWKAHVGLALTRAGYHLVLYEQKECDVVGVLILPGSVLIVGVEIERTARNALRNIERDCLRGCDAVVVVCASHTLREQIAEKAGTLPAGIQARVRFATISDLSDDVFRAFSTGTVPGLIPEKGQS